MPQNILTITQFLHSLKHKSTPAIRRPLHTNHDVPPPTIKFNNSRARPPTNHYTPISCPSQLLFFFTRIHQPYKSRDAMHSYMHVNSRLPRRTEKERLDPLTRVEDSWVRMKIGVHFMSSALRLKACLKGQKTRGKWDIFNEIRKLMSRRMISSFNFMKNFEITVATIATGLATRQVLAGSTKYCKEYCPFALLRQSYSTGRIMQIRGIHHHSSSHIHQPRRTPVENWGNNSFYNRHWRTSAFSSRFTHGHQTSSPWGRQECDRMVRPNQSQQGSWDHWRSDWMSGFNNHSSPESWSDKSFCNRNWKPTQRASSSWYHWGSEWKAKLDQHNAIKKQMWTTWSKEFHKQQYQYYLQLQHKRQRTCNNSSSSKSSNSSNFSTDPNSESQFRFFSSWLHWSNSGPRSWRSKSHPWSNSSSNPNFDYSESFHRLRNFRTSSFEPLMRKMFFQKSRRRFVRQVWKMKFVFRRFTSNRMKKHLNPWAAKLDPFRRSRGSKSRRHLYPERTKHHVQRLGAYLLGKDTKECSDTKRREIAKRDAEERMGGGQGEEGWHRGRRIWCEGVFKGKGKGELALGDWDLEQEWARKKRKKSEKGGEERRWENEKEECFLGETGRKVMRMISTGEAEGLRMKEIDSVAQLWRPQPFRGVRGLVLLPFSPHSVDIASNSAAFMNASRSYHTSSTSPSAFRNLRSKQSRKTLYTSSCHFKIPFPSFLFSLPSPTSLISQSIRSIHLPAVSALVKPILSILRSSQSLQSLTIFNRMSFSLFPISLFSNFPRSVSWGLLLLPMIGLLLINLVGLERTPVSGRWRTVWLNEEEEERMVGEVLRGCEVKVVQSGEGKRVKRDWLDVLKVVLNEPLSESKNGERTLLGSKVLDPREDWRVGWVENVLRVLEEGGVKELIEGGEKERSEEGEGTKPPKIRWELKGRHDGEKVNVGEGYDVMVLERDEANCFCFGFAPSSSKSPLPIENGSRGVIVVFTGFLDEILSKPPGGSKPLPPKFQSRPSTPEHSMTKEMFKGFFGDNYLGEYSIPTLDVLPTKEQSENLAVLLSHELSHLLLSHTLESFSSSKGQFLQHLSLVSLDMFRTVIWPITSLLGPFVNDALNESFKTFYAHAFDEREGKLRGLLESCRSRELEIEADLVGLRILSGSGIEPEKAVKFWEDRKNRMAEGEVGEEVMDGEVLPSTARKFRHLHHHHENLSSEELLKMSHPIDEERIEAIKEEIQKWNAIKSVEGFSWSTIFGSDSSPVSEWMGVLRALGWKDR